MSDMNKNEIRIRSRFRLPLRLIAAVLSLGVLAAQHASADVRNGQKPNILFIIMDDVGIDQMRTFGYGGLTPPHTPNIDAIANQGVKFRNAWAMPECSPSRVMFFNGRYPVRTNITGAITAADLANSQMSPYEYTTPRLLASRGYASGIFGKTHFAGTPLRPQNNPYGLTAPAQLGWDNFIGWADGAPNPIDTTAGGVADPGTYACGYVPNAANHPQGADSGACYTVDGACQVLTTGDAAAPGRACMERGGILVPNATCGGPRPSQVDFTLPNAFYAGDVIVNEKNGRAREFGPEHPSGIGRGYRTSFESQLSIDWIKSRPKGQPWMTTLGYSSAHAPYQAPPRSLLGPDAVNTDVPDFDCGNVPEIRVLMNQMIESMDTEIGRVLVETGIATRNTDGTLNYDPARSNTMVVIIGDNGTYTMTVKAPFDPLHAKAYVNQTGVWVPLIVAGPLVEAPGREVSAMVNAADLFALFAELGGVDLRKAIPATRAIDAVPMLPYLKNPDQAPLRATNWTQSGLNLRATTTVQGACVVRSVNVCTTLFPQKGLCEMEGGDWYGAGTTMPDVPSTGYSSCCQVQKFQLDNDDEVASVLPSAQYAVRNADYKLIRSITPTYQPGNDSCEDVEAEGFFEINQNTPIPRIDFPAFDLLLRPTGLSGAEATSLVDLQDEMERVLASAPPCVGDGNLDGRVDARDRVGLSYWRKVAGGFSTWFDFDLNGLTNDDDEAILAQNMGTRCAGSR
jgi:arylsulfatase A-like enzyme